MCRVFLKGSAAWWHVQLPVYMSSCLSLETRDISPDMSGGLGTYFLTSNDSQWHQSTVGDLYFDLKTPRTCSQSLTTEKALWMSDQTFSKCTWPRFNPTGWLRILRYLFCCLKLYAAPCWTRSFRAFEFIFHVTHPNLTKERSVGS